LFWGDRNTGSGSHLAAAAAAAKHAGTGDTSPTESSVAAAAAAKSALGIKDSDSPRKPAVLTKRRQHSDATKHKGDEPASAETKRKVTPNEGRPLSNRPASVTTAGSGDTVSTKSLRRATSVLSSTSSCDVQLPLTAAGAVAELIFMPVDISRMWLRHNPRVGRFGWLVADRLWEMLVIVAATVEACWRLVYVYSKTGKWRAPRVNGVRKDVWGLVWDVVRSFGYLVVLGALLVLGIRVVRWVFSVVRVVWWVLRVVAWVGKVLMGGGIGW
jgi:hypothetical protein